MADETLSVKIKLRDAARFAADAEMDRRAIKDVGDEAQRTGRKSKKAGKEINIFAGTITALRVVAVSAVVGLTLLSGPMAALAVGAIGLAGSLGSLIGLLGALPAAGALAGQGLGVVKLATQGLMDAVGPLSGAIDPDRFALLGPAAQDFALALDAMKGPVRDLQGRLQAGLFPGLTRGLIAARPALDALADPLANTSRILGSLGERLGRLVGSAGFLADLRSQAQFNNVQIARLGGAGLHLVNVLRNLMVGSRGLVGWVVKLAAGWADTADTTVASWRASGKLADMFETVRLTTERVGKILWRLGVALFNVGRIGKREIGDGLLVWLLRTVTAFERWTSSPEGIARITQGFRDARDTLRDVAAFMVRAGGAMSTTVIPTIAALADALRPILAEGSGGFILTMYANGLRLIATAAGFLIQNVPGASGALSALFAVLIVNKIAGFNVLAGVIRAVGAAALFATAPMAGLSTAFWALNASMAANPLVWIAGAIIAVGTAFYLAYTKIEPFRNAVDWVVDRLGDLWDLLKKVGAALAKFTSGAIGKALGVVQSINPFAAGGIVNTPLQIVGERGPELAALPIGSRVFTASQTESLLRPPRGPEVATQRLRPPRTAPVQRAAGGPGAVSPIHVHVHSTLKMDRRTIAKGVSDVIVDEKANG
ncbi:MAG: hypothetical protein LC798_15560 [Chloroflexi bacterium]|nr:hypothetical protein [Chloroflexota bacterium]